MNLRQQITPKNDNGSIDHRYVPIAKAIAELAVERVETQLRKLYVATNNLEKESASAPYSASQWTNATKERS